MEKWIADNGNGTYTNPILYTDYSDPDVIRVDDDYFMVASSFCNMPGLPILHSKDLVNWRVINYAVKGLDFDRYKKPAHGCGIWAPAIRYHNGWYWIFIPMPDEGIFVTKAKNPWEEWSKLHCIYKGKGWIDPCPFWDDDGRAYMVSAYAKSRIGFKSILHLTEMTPDCSELINEGKDIFDGNVENQPTIEGPKLYKRNGYYYIFAPAGGVKPGWQVVLRSKNIWGPYEYKNVLRQGNTLVNGPHQGAWVVTQTGEDWFIHFQDVYAAGRIIHLQPMKWINDWPVIGEPVLNADYGVPVNTYKKPDVGKEYPVISPEISDEFNGNKLGLQWQFNGNYKEEWYKVENGSLTLLAVENKNSSISDAANILLQKWAFPQFDAFTELDLTSLENSAMAGMMSMGTVYGALAVKKENDRLKLISVTGQQHFNNELATAVDNIEEIEELKGSIIYLKNTVRKIGIREKAEIENAPVEEITLEYSLDNKQYKKAVVFNAEPGRWVGVKHGVFCIGNKGSVKVNYFKVKGIRG